MNHNFSEKTYYKSQFQKLTLCFLSVYKKFKKEVHTYVLQTENKIIFIFLAIAIMLRIFFVILHIFQLITFAYGDNRPIVQILGHRILNCTANENNFNELDCKCAHSNVSWNS